MYQEPKTLRRRKEKKSKCKLDNALVLSGKNLPQCTVGDLSVVCTIHHFAYIEKRYNRKKNKTHHMRCLE